MCSIEGGTKTLNAPADATQLTVCATFTGSIEVSAAFQGELILDGVEQIQDSLIMSDVPLLTNVSAPNLQCINDSLVIAAAEQLSSLDFPMATLIGGINMTSVGAKLKSVNFPLLDTIGSMHMQDTSLQSLEGFPSWVNVQSTIEILDNLNLADITLKLTNVSAGITIHGNGGNGGNNGAHVSFDDLTSAGYIDIMGASSVDFPKLQETSLSLHNNTFTAVSLSSFLLSTSFSIQNNPYLTVITAPVYQTAGLPANVNADAVAMQISNNAVLDTFGFQGLQEIDGAILNGTFQGISFPSLKNISRSFTVHSTADISDSCTNLHAVNFISGTFNCSYPGGDVSSNSTTGDTDSETPSHSGSNHGAVIGGSVGGVVAFFVLLAMCVVACVFWRLRRKANKQGGGGGGIELQNSDGYRDGGFYRERVRK